MPCALVLTFCRLKCRSSTLTYRTTPLQAWRGCSITLLLVSQWNTLIWVIIKSLLWTAILLLQVCQTDTGVLEVISTGPVSSIGRAVDASSKDCGFEPRRVCTKRFTRSVSFHLYLMHYHFKLFNIIYMKLAGVAIQLQDYELWTWQTKIHCLVPR